MGIIVARHGMPIIELTPMGVNYDLTVEEMIAGYAQSDPDITSEHFPNCRSGRTGIVTEIGLCLVKPVSSGSGQGYSDSKVEEMVTAAGYSFEELSVLGALKEHADELWNAGIWYIVARGPNSRWRSPLGLDVVCFNLYPGYRRFDLNRLENSWRGFDWFLCRKSQPSGT